MSNRRTDRHSDKVDFVGHPFAEFEKCLKCQFEVVFFTKISANNIGLKANMVAK